MNCLQKIVPVLVEKRRTQELNRGYWITGSLRRVRKGAESGREALEQHIADEDIHADADGGILPVATIGHRENAENSSSYGGGTQSACVAQST